MPTNPDEDLAPDTLGDAGVLDVAGDVTSGVETGDDLEWAGHPPQEHAPDAHVESDEFLLQADDSVHDPDTLETQDISDIVEHRRPVGQALRERLKRSKPSKRARRKEADAEYLEAKRAFRQAERERKRRERHERHRFTQQQRIARRRLLIALSAVSVLLLAVGVGVFTPLMSVQEIDVRGTDRIPVASITEALQPVEGRPLALVTDDDVQTRLEPLSLIESFSAEKIPPRTLRIVVTERQPVVAIPHGEHLLLVDPAGVRIDQIARDARPEGIPLAQGVGTEYDSDEFIAMATALKSMPDEVRNRIGEVSASTPQQITVTLTDGLPVVWGDAAQNTRKAMVLEAMLDALTGVSLRSVDVSSPDAPVYVPG